MHALDSTGALSSGIPAPGAGWGAGGREEKGIAATTPLLLYLRGNFSD